MAGVWLEKLEDDKRRGVSLTNLLKKLKDFKLASDFSAEASVDMVHISAKGMVAYRVAQRALWLKSWGQILPLRVVFAVCHFWVPCCLGRN